MRSGPDGVDAPELRLPASRHTDDDGRERVGTPAAPATELSRARERGVRFLLARQGADGLWRDFHTPAADATEWPTGYVGAALARAGVDEGALDRAAEALLARQNRDGGWGYHEDVPTDADSTACVLLLLAATGRVGAASRRAASCLVAHQRADGGVEIGRASW